MCLGIDFPPKNFFGTGNGEVGDLFTQRFLCALGGGSSFVFSGLTGCIDDATGFLTGFVNQLGDLFFRTSAEIGGGLTGLAQFVCGALFGVYQIGFCFVGCSEAFGNFGRTLIQCFHDGGPDVLLGDPRQHEKHYELRP